MIVFENAVQYVNAVLEEVEKVEMWARHFGWTTTARGEKIVSKLMTARRALLDAGAEIRNEREDQDA